jgi:four helix bundle protein
MTNWTTLPYQNLIAYQVARELVVIIREAKIADAKLRDQALRAATSACLNIAEAVGRVTEPDKARVYALRAVKAARQWRPWTWLPRLDGAVSNPH